MTGWLSAISESVFALLVFPGFAFLFVCTLKTKYTVALYTYAGWTAQGFDPALFGWAYNIARDAVSRLDNAWIRPPLNTWI